MSLHLGRSLVNAPAPASYAYSESGEFQYTFTIAKRSDIVFMLNVIGMLTTVWKRLLTLLLIVDPTIRQTVIKGMLYYNIVYVFLPVKKCML